VKLLLDSHTLIWAVDDPAKLTAPAESLLQDPSHDRLLSRFLSLNVRNRFDARAFLMHSLDPLLRRTVSPRTCSPRDSRHIWADENLRFDKRPFLAAVSFARKPAASRRAARPPPRRFARSRLGFQRQSLPPSCLPAFLIKRPKLMPQPRLRRRFPFPPAFTPSLSSFPN
jgi:hypothetical protein